MPTLSAADQRLLRAIALVMVIVGTLGWEMRPVIDTIDQVRLRDWATHAVGSGGPSWHGVLISTDALIALNVYLLCDAAIAFGVLLAALCVAVIRNVWEALVFVVLAAGLIALVRWILRDPSNSGLPTGSLVMMVRAPVAAGLLALGVPALAWLFTRGYLHDDLDDLDDDRGDAAGARPARADTLTHAQGGSSAG